MEAVFAESRSAISATKKATAQADGYDHYVGYGEQAQRCEETTPRFARSPHVLHTILICNQTADCRIVGFNQSDSEV